MCDYAPYSAGFDFFIEIEYILQATYLCNDIPAYLCNIHVILCYCLCVCVCIHVQYVCFYGLMFVCTVMALVLFSFHNNYVCSRNFNLFVVHNVFSLFLFHTQFSTQLDKRCIN